MVNQYTYVFVIGCSINKTWFGNVPGQKTGLHTVALSGQALSHAFSTQAYIQIYMYIYIYNNTYKIAQKPQTNSNRVLPNSARIRCRPPKPKTHVIPTKTQQNLTSDHVNFVCAMGVQNFVGALQHFRLCH